jgi:hypothetical protein
MTWAGAGVVAALGAVFGGIANAKAARDEHANGLQVAGAISGAGADMIFTTAGGRAVSLAEHARAVVYELPRPSRASLSDALKGAGLMILGTAASAFLSIFGMAGAAWQAGKYNGIAAYGGKLYESMAGSAAVLYAGVGLIASQLMADEWNWAAIAAYLGVSGLAGAVWGLFVLPRYRRGLVAMKTVAAQWWGETKKESRS